MDILKYSDDPMKWDGLLNAATGNIITAIKQLRRIGWSDADIIGLLKLEIKRENKRKELKRLRKNARKNNNKLS